jgi:signal transduction histidine kinase
MMVISPALVGVFALLFFDNFLHLKRKNKYYHFGINLFVGLYAIVIGVGVLGYFRFAAKSVLIVALMGSLFVLAVAARLSYKGSRQAKFFLVSWTVFLISVIIFVLKNFGVLPYNNYTYYALQAGSALEVILLSFALADRINILQAQTLASNAAALRAAKDSEQFMVAQNALLDGLVKERTKELEKSHTDLELSFRNLQEKESQLVESEKMASLGQLTAGIAHEINNPINFVTSNVKPLKRDVDILVDMVGQVEAIGLAETPLEEKKKQMDDVKTELDYDYLINEIDYLLNGISEGASRTAEIVKGLRVFSRLDEDDLKKADINEGLSSTLVIVNHMLNNAIEVDKQYSGIPLIECYPGKLNQVFLNMMGNAIYAIHKHWNGQPGGKLTIKTSNDETHIHVSISDNGIGMDEATRKKLFEPFFTTKDVGEGTGLGLSIAYNTILKHNGTVEVLSEKGVGTEFLIKLPINQSYSLNG